MTNTENDGLTQTVDELRQFSARLSSSIPLFRWVGYGLLILAGFDIIDALYPPQLTNPAWEFQTIGALVERVPVPLLGFILVFFGEQYFRTKIERPVIKVLSWLTLILGIMFLLLVPLGIFDTIRLEKQSSEQIKSQVDQRKEQIKQFKDQLDKTTTPQQMEQLLQGISNAPDIKNPQEVGKIKDQLSNFVGAAEGRIDNESQEVQSNRRKALLKNSIKWNLGALISGLLYISIWRLTRWARRTKR